MSLGDPTAGDQSRHRLPGVWAWGLLIAGLAAAGILLALGDIAIGNHSPNPLATVMVGPNVIASPAPGRTQTLAYDRNRLGQRFFLDGRILGFAGFGPVSPFQALRAFLSNGAGLVLLALGALVLFPERARNAVEHVESPSGAAIAFAAGMAMALLTLAAITLLRFTLIFLAVIPVVLVSALAAAMFGVACISLAIGRLIRRRLALADVHPLVAALVGALVVFDLAVIPYAGVFALAALAIAGLGLAVVTRFGSTGGWSFRDLSW